MTTNEWTCEVCGTRNDVDSEDVTSKCKACETCWTQDDVWYQNVKLFRAVENKENWKLPTRPIVCNTEEEAKDYFEAIIFFQGGAELNKTPNGRYLVTGKGYYHYVGA